MALLCAVGAEFSSFHFRSLQLHPIPSIHLPPSPPPHLRLLTTDLSRHKLIHIRPLTVPLSLSLSVILLLLAQQDCQDLDGWREAQLVRAEPPLGACYADCGLWGV